MERIITSIKGPVLAFGVNIYREAGRYNVSSVVLVHDCNNRYNKLFLL